MITQWLKLSGGSLFGCFLLCLTCGESVARGEEIEWKKESAIAYLDGRQTWWMTSKMAKQPLDTTCVACHTGLPYALARPSLGGDPARYEATLLNIRKRVEKWDEVGPLYASKAEGSRGTEAIVNALILGRADAREELRTMSPTTAKAFEHLWELQHEDGPAKGSWPWLQFGKAGFEPWEATDSGYFGTALAALAIGTAPGAIKTAPPDRVAWLRDYLTTNYDGQNLHGRIALLWASTKLEGILSAERRRKLIGEIFELQQNKPGDPAVDGGWNVASLGPWVRKDRTPQIKSPDGYATGLIVYTLRQAGVAAPDQPKLQKGLAWLKRNQEAKTGAWPGNSVHKTRDPDTDEAWKFPRDAATAFASMALTDADAGTRDAPRLSSK